MIKRCDVRLFIVILSFCILVSCKVQFIAAYDPITDQGIQKVQTDITTLLVSVQKNMLIKDTAANNYRNFTKSYNEIEGELETLRIRVNAVPKNNIVNSELGLLGKNIDNLEKLHQSGLFARTDTALVGINLRIMEVQFKSMIVLQSALKKEDQNK